MPFLISTYVQYDSLMLLIGLSVAYIENVAFFFLDIFTLLFLNLLSKIYSCKHLSKIIAFYEEYCCGAICSKSTILSMKYRINIYWNHNNWCDIEKIC